MKKTIILVWSLTLLLNSFSQLNEPNQRVSDRYQVNSIDTYKLDQTQFDKMNINDIDDSFTLYNYYFTVLHANYPKKNTTEIKSKLNDILQRLSAINANSFESKYIYYIQNKNTSEGLESLRNAHSIEPNNTDLWDDMMAYFYIKGEMNQAKNIAAKIRNSSKYASDLYSYQKNVINSTTGNSVIFTNGELDTFPLLTLLLTEKQNRNIKVINYKLLNNQKYRKQALNGIGCASDISPINKGAFMESLEKLHLNYNLYVALTNEHNVLKSMENKLFLTGLTFRYSSERINNIEICLKNYKDRYEMNYLYNKRTVRAEIRGLNRNYLPVLNLIQKGNSSLSDKQLKKISGFSVHIKNNLN